MAEHVGRGSLTGTWKLRPGSIPNIRGGITIERDLPANTRLWLTGWTKTISGGQFVSLRVEIADKGARTAPTDECPRGVMKNMDTIHRSSAADFLRRSLAGGALAVSELEVKAREEGLLGQHQQLQNAKAFKTAKRLLDIKSARRGFGKAGVWTWRLPPQPSSPSANPPPPPLAKVHLREAPYPTVNTAGGLALDLRGRSVLPEWAHGIASLDHHRAPKDVPLNRWRVFVDDCQRFLVPRKIGPSALQSSTGMPMRCLDVAPFAL